MTENVYPDIETLCRLCLKEHEDAFSIFETDDALSIPMRIIACVSLEAKATDGLPKQICAECRYQLEKAFLFRQRSQLADKKLRKHIRLIGMGKKSRVFAKSPEENDYDEDELEFEDSIAFINQQEKVREKSAQELREKYKREMNEELEKRLKASKLNLRAEIDAMLRTELKQEVRSEVRLELLDEVQEESRKEQLAKLVGELEIFLAEKKAGLWETVDDSDALTVETKPELTTTEPTRKRRCSPTLKLPQLPQRLKLEQKEEYEEDLSEAEDNAADELAAVEIEATQIPSESADDLQDIQMDGAEVVSVRGQAGEIYIINNTESEKPNTEFHIEPMGKNFTSYNIKDNGEIQFSRRSKAETEQVENVVLLDLDAELGDELNLSEFDQDVIILPDEKLEQVVTNVKRTRNDFVLKHKTKAPREGSPKAGRISDTMKTFRCQLCPIEFATEKALTRHLNTHVKAQKNGKGTGYKCPICELQLSCASSLKRHMLIHTGIKPHKCNQCNQSFVQREVLKRHMDIHTGEKRHQCPHCSSRFAQKTNLQQHVAKVHMDSPRMHQCHLCHRTFSHVSGLSRHLVSHAGIMFACKECGRQFSDRSSIKRHVHNVHNVKDKLIDGYVTEAEPESVIGN